MNDFKSLVVDLRRVLIDLTQIPDIFAYLEASDVYQCRSHVNHIDRLLRVIVFPAPSFMPQVDISMSGVSLPSSVVRSELSALLSFVRHPKFVSNDFGALGRFEG